MHEMMGKGKETANYLKVINFNYPEWIPALVSIMPAAWIKNGEEVEKVVLAHPSIRPRYQKGDFKNMKLPRPWRKGKWKDSWGVTWLNIEEGLDSAPVDELAPLRNWEELEKYKPPDPLKYSDIGEKIDWNSVMKDVENAKRKGNLAKGGISHGAMYMRLYYLRGFSNLMMDIGLKEPKLEKLIKMVLDYNLRVIEKWLEIGVEIMHFGDDLGIQKSLPISPKEWRHYLKPCFSQMFGKCREKGVYIHFHSDGHILEIIPDLIECGITVINPQIGANTLEGIEKHCKGKIAINLDIDRQLLPFATPSQIKEHIKRAVETLALPEGGLALTIECEQDVPLENIETIFKTLEMLGCRGV